MGRNEYNDFAKKAESLVRPVDSTTISFFGSFLGYLPLPLQRSMMNKGGAKTSYMGFIVDPYCFFLAYPVKDLTAAQAMLPEGYELADAAVFAGGEKRPLVIISAFTLRTSVFAGMRVECYLIARSKATGRVAWIITDYETNTLTNDPKNGFWGYSCEPAVFAVTAYGELLAQAENAENGNRYSIGADITGGSMRDLERDLWVEGNMAVDYGGVMAHESSKPFSLIFDPALMKEAREIPLEAVRIAENSFMKGLIDGDKPCTAAVFPYTQHFVIRQDLEADSVAHEKDLLDQVRVFMERKDFKRMEGSDITKSLLRGMIASSVLNACLIIAMVVKILFF